ncbi:MAG: mobilization protein [Steroidobacteraceae bacterium]
MGAKIADRIDGLEQRLKQLRAQQQRQEARRRSIETRRTRREDLRRKVLVGAVVLARVERGLLEDAVLKGWLDPAITREEDRAICGLPEKR